MQSSIYCILWEFRVKPGSERSFETLYGPYGAWARLFGRAEGYLGTDLLQDTSAPGRYLTLDRWVSQAAYDSFRVQRLAEYRTLDLGCESLTDTETPLGGFITVAF